MGNAVTHRSKICKNLFLLHKIFSNFKPIDTLRKYAPYQLQQ